MNVKDIGEFGLIDATSKFFEDLVPEGCLGIGDDCAVIPAGGDKFMVITTDMLVEDVHFLRDKISAQDLGYKSAAVNLSDVAAMGAVPHSLFLSVSFPANLSKEWYAEFVRGIKEHQVPLLGGDTTNSKTGKITINIVAVGCVDKNNIKLRKGARVGDCIYVTSALGDSAGGLQAILNSKEKHLSNLVAQHSRPRPHLAEGAKLGKSSLVSAMIDISDGLASDLRHILKASNVGAVIELSSIPISEELKISPWDAEKLALTGGEDYCLLFTASEQVDFDFPCYKVGYITERNIGNIEWQTNGQVVELDYIGYRHF